MIDPIDTSDQSLTALIAVAREAQTQIDQALSTLKPAMSAIAHLVAARRELAVGDRLHCVDADEQRRITLVVTEFRVWRDVAAFDRAEPLVEAVGKVILANGQTGRKEVAEIINGAKSRVTKLPPK